MGAENDTHSTTTTLTPNDYNHTVIATKDCSGVVGPSVPDDRGGSKPQHLFPETLHITPATLVELAPRLAPYVPPRTSDRNWPAIVEAALYLAGEMGINSTLWARVRDMMGPEYAAVALAIVSTKRVGPNRECGEIQSPGGYFAGMLRKFENNSQDLNLARTLYGLKDQVWGTQGHKERRELEKAHRRSASREAVKPTVCNLPVRTVLTSHADTPSTPLPTRSELPASVASASKHWRPPSAMLEEARQIGLRVRRGLQKHGENGTESTFAKPNNGTMDPATPQDNEED